MNVTRLVEEKVRGDLVLQEALARDIVNVRALARWLLQTTGWDATEESVISALRRQNVDNRTDPFQSARESLIGANTSMRSRMAIVQVRRTQEARKSMAQAFETVDYARDEVLRAVAGDRGLRLVVDERNVDRLLKIFRAADRIGIERGLAELSIHFHQGPLSPAGLLALVAARLGLQDIHVSMVIDGPEQMVFLVKEQDALRAYQTLSDMGKD